MYDFLLDNFINPKVLLLNCLVHDDHVTAEMGFIAMGLKQGRTFVLCDRRDTKIVEIELPRAGYQLPRDIALNLAEEKFFILKHYA